MAHGILDGLNAQQRQAAETLDRHILLLAGAGTGKTGTLACRVAHILHTAAAKPEQVLCLTFTNRACREMRERIHQMIGEAAQQVGIFTIHSFCVQLLRETPQALGDIGPDFGVCDEQDALEIIRAVSIEAIGREPNAHAAMILQRFVQLVKELELTSPATNSEHAVRQAFEQRLQQLEQLCRDERRNADPKFLRFLGRYGASILRLYNQKLRQNNLLDFCDLLLLARQALQTPETAVLWNTRYRFIHVDEVQDVSLGEYELLQGLFGNALVMLCGDFNQTIYQWRGSDPGGLRTRFERDYRPLTLHFEKNYRSSGQLLAATQNFLFCAFGHGEGITEVPDEGDIILRQFETSAEEVDWIGSVIAGLGLTNFSRVAIITRTNKACADVCRLIAESSRLREMPVRFMLADDFKLFRKAEIKDVTACLSLLINPQDGQSLRRLLTRLPVGVGRATIDAILREQEQTGVLLTDFIDPRTQLNADFFEPLLTALEAGRVVVFDVESTGTDVYTDEIVQIAAARLAPDGTPAQTFERFIRPNRPVGTSEQVHHFSDAFLQQRGEAPADVLLDFLAFVDDCVIVGHNVGFDMQITRSNLARHNIVHPFKNLYFDTLDLARRYLGKLENHKLLTVSQALGVTHTPTHDAMDDILATAQVLTALCAQHVRPGSSARRAVYQKHLPRFSRISQMLSSLCELAAPDVTGLLAQISEVFSFARLYEQQPERLEAIERFVLFAGEVSQPSLPLRRQIARLLELTALSAGAFEQIGQASNRVAVITAHQSKGCEFDYVFLPVLQEGVFPSIQAVRSGALSEEKRVFYVSVTRARKKLYLSWARYNENQYLCKPSGFLKLFGLEIDS